MSRPVEKIDEEHAAEATIFSGKVIEEYIPCERSVQEVVHILRFSCLYLILRFRERCMSLEMHSK